MKLCPLFGNIVLEEITETEQKTQSGIILPESSQEKSQQKLGKVLAVGEGEYLPITIERHLTQVTTQELARLPMRVSVGDTVVFKSWGANEVRLMGKNYLILNQKDVLARIEK